MWKERKYIYVGDAIPKITQERHADFIRYYQKSILLSLAKRGLLTPSQLERCLEELGQVRK